MRFMTNVMKFLTFIVIIAAIVCIVITVRDMHRSDDDIYISQDTCTEEDSTITSVDQASSVDRYDT